MRRKVRTLPHAKRKAFVYTCALLALVVYGVPRIPSLQPGLAGSFSAVWILFAALALAANLYFLFGADEERSRLLELHASSGQTRAEDSAPGHRLRGRQH